MTRGRTPLIAIGEAQRKVQAQGLTVCSPGPDGNQPFHFITCDRDRICLVRVRRLKYHDYDVAAVEQSCRNDIAVIRALSFPQEICRELWVRGPDRAWHRYHVMPGSLVLLNGQEITMMNRP